MVRILHTSDWHVGRSLYNHSRLAEQVAVLDEIVALAAEAKPDVIIHSGDVFDWPRPATEHLQVALDALRRLGEIAPTVVLAGNHDSPALFDVFGMLLGPSSAVRLIARALPPAKGGIIDLETAGGERVRIAPVPFVHANRFVPAFEDAQRAMGTYSERIGHINKGLAEGLADGFDPSRDVLVHTAHCYVSGAHLAQSERKLHVGDAYLAQAQTLPLVSYAALGHIHRPQQLAGKPARYAGSPLALDFGEESDVKSTVLVEAAPGKAARIETVGIASCRRLARLDGTIEQIEALAPDIGAALVTVTVRCEDPIDGLADRIAALMPDADVLDIVEDVASRRLEALDSSAAAEESQRDVDELLQAYLGEVGTSQASADRVLAMFGTLREALESDEPMDLVAGNGAGTDEPPPNDDAEPADDGEADADPVEVGA